MNASSDPTKSKAYLIFSEFGPNLRIPRQKRLADEFSFLSDENIQTWLADFQDVDKKIWKLAEEGEGKISIGKISSNRLLLNILGSMKPPCNERGHDALTISSTKVMEATACNPTE